MAQSGLGDGLDVRRTVRWKTHLVLDGRRHRRRICPVMRVCRWATAMVVIEALEEARRTFGLPHTIRVDQGCQFTSKELDLWA
jgi:hypothetical protein